MHKRQFVFGIAAGVLFSATLNAISYFFRSSGWTGLTDPHSTNSTPQAIGFPFELWRYGGSYGGALIAQRAAVLNVASALAIGVILGLVAIWKWKWLAEFEAAMIEEETRREDNAKPLQFSLRGLLLTTSVAAIGASLARGAIGSRPELLTAIFLLGPTFLIVLAMLPRGVQWQYRMIILTPSTLLFIGFAIFVGQRLNLEFDRVMMGIFVFWVPQTVIAAACLTSGFAIRYHRGRKKNNLRD